MGLGSDQWVIRQSVSDVSAVLKVYNPTEAGQNKTPLPQKNSLFPSASLEGIW